MVHGNGGDKKAFAVILAGSNSKSSRTVVVRDKDYLSDV